MGEKFNGDLPKRGDAKGWFELARKAVDDETGKIVKAVEESEKDDYRILRQKKSKQKSVEAEPFTNLTTGDHRSDRLGVWEKGHDRWEDEHPLH